MTARTLADEPNELVLRVTGHLGCDISEVVPVAERFPIWDHVNVQRAWTRTSQRTAAPAPGSAPRAAPTTRTKGGRLRCRRAADHAVGHQSLERCHGGQARHPTQRPAISDHDFVPRPVLNGSSKPVRSASDERELVETIADLRQLRRGEAEVSSPGLHNSILCSTDRSRVQGSAGGSQSGSQLAQSAGYVRRHPASVVAGRWHMGPRQATRGELVELIWG